jgi:hypothetical protein
MGEVVAQALIDRALLLMSVQPGSEPEPAPTVAMLLDDFSLVGLRPHAVILAAIAAARAALARWVEGYPDRAGPPLAVIAAESWAVSPSEETAQAAAGAAELAVTQALGVWHGSRQHAAWAGRTAAWAAMAPKYGWPAVAALFGACQALGKRQIVSVVAESLAEA